MERDSKSEAKVFSADDFVNERHEDLQPSSVKVDPQLLDAMIFMQYAIAESRQHIREVVNNAQKPMTKDNLSVLMEERTILAYGHAKTQKMMASARRIASAHYGVDREHFNMEQKNMEIGLATHLIDESPFVDCQGTSMDFYRRVCKNKAAPNPLPKGTVVSICGNSIDSEKLPKGFFREGDVGPTFDHF